MCFCFLLVFSFSFSFRNTNENSRKPKSFTFMNYLGKEFTLTKPDQYINNNRNPIRRLSKKILGHDESDEGAWYYVHFLTKDFKELHNRLGLTVKDTILKNTFILFLNIDQLERIQNISLVKKIESSEKFSQDGGPIQKTKYLIAVIAPNYSLPLNPDLYTIVRQNSEDSYLIAIEQNDLNSRKYNKKKNKAITALTSLNYVKKVETYIFPKVKNNLMTGYTQKNMKIGDRLIDEKTGIPYLPRYINDKGIRGENQIITIQDTPIDFHHAMFRESSTIELNKHMPNNRKIIYYGTTAKTLTQLRSMIEENEHGTHVAGTTAGKSICSNDDTSGTSFFNGNAPEAKILYAGDLNDVKASDLASLMKSYNSYISTNSWGVDGYNDYYNFQYGKLAYDNPTRLFLFAAGNEYDQGNFTVCDPGGSKNVLTVGAIDDFLSNYHYYTIKSLKTSTSVKGQALLDADPWTIGSIGTTTDKKVVVIDCTVASNRKCDNLYGATYITLLYATSNSEYEWIYNCKGGDTNGIILTTDGKVKDILNEGRVNITDITEFNNNKKILHADYSSGGPGNRNILKPDIMTPGTHITSAKSRAGVSKDHGCRDDDEADFTYMQGTSMATPNAAGAVALVRQYFEEGKWLNTKIQLDSPAMRALMINSCVHPSSKTPDILFGHGVVDLSTVLPFDDSFGLQMTNISKPPSIEEESHLVAIVDVTDNTVDFQVTLSYLDPMLEQSSTIPITHDLDLIVASSDGKTFTGDHLASGDTQHFSTNEKVIIKKNEIVKGQYVIHIYSSDFVDSSLADSVTKQSFAVVATGNIANKTLVFGKPSSGGGDTGSGDTGSGDTGSGDDTGSSGDTGGGNTGDDDDDIFIDVGNCPCSKCNPKDPSECLCDDTHIGPLCQAEVTVVNGNSGSFNVFPMELKRIRFICDKEIKTIKSKAKNKAENASLWYSNECHLSLNEYENSGQVGSFLKKSISVDPALKDICIAIYNTNVETATYEIELSDKKSYTNLIIGIVVGVAGAGIIGVVSYCLCKKGCCSKLGVGNAS